MTKLAGGNATLFYPTSIQRRRLHSIQR